MDVRINATGRYIGSTSVYNLCIGSGRKSIAQASNLSIFDADLEPWREYFACCDLNASSDYSFRSSIQMVRTTMPFLTIKSKSISSQSDRRRARDARMLTSRRFRISSATLCCSSEFHPCYLGVKPVEFQSQPPRCTLLSKHNAPRPFCR